MTSLSPAANAVLNAAHDGANKVLFDIGDDSPVPMCAAAALRAAADQVVPEPAMTVEGGRTYEEAWTATVHEAVRRQLLAIAAELRGNTEVTELSTEQAFAALEQHNV